jgi:adenine/guanine/hypoxanthine permease
MAASASGFRPRLWVAGDWNAFFGLFTNVVLNVIVLSSLVLGVLKLPESIVYGRILPALGIALPLGNIFYAYLAYRLARTERRETVAAMPYGPSVPHMFIVVFVIMLPVLLETHDPIKAWEAGLAWAFIIGVIVLLGAFIGPTIRAFTPRAAMLGTLAGISIAFISMRPAFQMWEAPWIAFVVLAIILVSWVANVRLPFGVPGGLAAVVIGTAVGWVSVLLGWTGVLVPAAVGESLKQFGLHLPIPGGEVLRGLRDVGPLLATAIPLGVYNFTEGMNNVESAAAAGDSYNLRWILLADGTGAVVGSFLGSPFPPAVYIGHPGWKAVGGRIGYSLATGIVIGLVAFLGLVALLLKVIPIQALLPILLFIGLVIGAQAFQATPSRHAPAVVLALLPNIALWAKTLVDDALAAAGTNAAKLGLDKMGVGDIYHGMALFGGGAVLAGMVLGAIAAFVIDREFNRATVAALSGAVLSLFGLINGVGPVGWNVSPEVTLGYLLTAASFAVASWHAGELTAANFRALVRPLPAEERVGGD